MRRPNAQDLQYAQKWGVSGRTIVAYGLERLLRIDPSARRLLLKPLAKTRKGRKTMNPASHRPLCAGVVDSAIQFALKERGLVK